jgi:hypothetical protein
MKKLFIFILLIITACKNKTDNKVIVQVDKTNGIVKVSGIQLVTLHGIKADTLSMEAFQNLLPVYAMPADTDMRNDQPAIKGTYTVSDSTLNFTPDTAFKAGQTYFARYYRYDEQITGMDLVMHRRKLGKANYSELIFKY